MNHRMLTITLAGALSLSLLTACGGTANPTPTPPASEPAVSDTPAPTETVLPTQLPETGPTAAPEPSAEPEAPAPSATPESKPTSTPETQPSKKPAPTQAPSTPPAAPSATPAPAPEVSPVQSVWNDIYNGLHPEARDSFMDLDDETLLAVYGISTGDLESYLCKVPLMNVKATEYFIAEVKDGKMDAVKACVQSRQASLDEQWRQYLPDQYELVKNYKLVTNGNYILFVVSEDADAAVTAFNTYTK